MASWLLWTYDERSVVYHRQGRIGTYAIYWGHEAMQAGSVMPSSATTGSSRATASRRSACCAGCRPRRCSRGGADIPPAGGTRSTGTLPRSASRSVPVMCRTPPGSRGGKKLRGERTCAIATSATAPPPRARSTRGKLAADAGPRALLQQQPVGDLDAGLGADGRRDVADKAVGYGMPGVRVDGGDVLAVYEASGSGRAGTRGRGSDVHRVSDLPGGAARDSGRSAGIHRSRARREGEAAECVGRYEGTSAGRGSSRMSPPRLSAPRRADARRDRPGRGRAARRSLPPLRAGLRRPACRPSGGPRRAAADPRQ